MEKKIHEAQWVLERTLHFVSTAEIKVGAIIALNTALLAALGALVKPQGMTCYEWLIGALCLVCVMVAFGCAAMVLVPRTNGPTRSLIFFGMIAQFERADYGTRFREATDDDLLQDLTDQIHRNAEIALAKHRWVMRCLRTSIAAAAFWFWAVVLTFW